MSPVQVTDQLSHPHATICRDQGTFGKLNMSDSQEIPTARDRRLLLSWAIQSSTRPGIHSTSLLLHGNITLPYANAGLQTGHDTIFLTLSTEPSAMCKEERQVNHKTGRCTPANNWRSAVFTRVVTANTKRFSSLTYWTQRAPYLSREIKNTCPVFGPQL